jgi:hypothetical protein
MRARFDDLARQVAFDGAVIIRGLERPEIEVANVDGFLWVKTTALATFEIAEIRRRFLHTFSLSSRTVVDRLCDEMGTCEAAADSLSSSPNRRRSGFGAGFGTWSPTHDGSNAKRLP